MRQRAKLAQAMAHDPDVLILDEPLNGLDPPGRRELSDVIRACGAEGRCVLVSSHILHEVESLTPNVLLISTGRVLAEGSVAKIRARATRASADGPHPDPRAGPAGQRCWRPSKGPSASSCSKEAWTWSRSTPTRYSIAWRRWLPSDPATILAVEPLDEDLEAVFRYLTR